MRVLVLGGTGLISTAITRQLQERGDEVTHFNRGKSTSEPPEGVVTLRGDRSDLAALRAVPPGFDAVVDMICYTPADAKSAVAAFRGRTSHYVMCSTVDVFTKPARSYPVDESFEKNPSPSFRYAYEKARCEEILNDAHDRLGFPMTILRPAATYLDSAVPSIGTFDLALERMRADQPIVIHGDGSSLWAACHRNDVARAFVNCLGLDRAKGRSYNLPAHEVLTWNQYWHAVADALGVDFRAVHIPTDMLGAAVPHLAAWCVENFQYDNVFSYAPALADLGFEYTVTWAEGIAQGVMGRQGRPIDPGECAEYERLVSAWTVHTSQFVADLRGVDA